MNKNFKLIFSIFFLLALAVSQNLFAHNQIVENILKENFDVSYIISSELSKDKNWALANTVIHKNNQNNVYLVNLKNPAASFTAYENCEKNSITVCDIAYNPANKNFYFFIDNGIESPLGIRTFKDSGLYVLSKTATGEYLKENVHRYYRLENWGIDAVVQNYLTLPKNPDYEGFYKFFTDFADSPYKNSCAFCLKNDEGTVLKNQDAAKYLYEKGDFDNFIYRKNKWNCFPLADFVKICDESGNPTEKTAVSYYSTDNQKFFCPFDGLNSSRTDLEVLKGTLYLTHTYGSVHSDRLWHNDYSLIYKLNEDNADAIFIEENDELKKIRAEKYEWSANSKSPLEKIYKSNKEAGFLIADSDQKSVWFYDGKTSVKYDSRYDFEKKNRSGTVKFTPKDFALIFLSFLSLCFIAALIFVINKRQNAKSQNLINTIQEKEREKIAGDIHDSVVQDLRAIRLKAEMLDVNQSSAEKHHQVIDEITLCIKKMRDICYGLSPAELKVFGEDDKADFYSIVQTLGEQFTVRTNIPCTVKFSDGRNEAANLFLEKEDCLNLVRIVQEALKNIEKHSFATQAQILIRAKNDENGKNREIRLFITDDGRGCNLKKVMTYKNAKNHFGLRMMKERAMMIEGCQIDFRSALNDGMQVKIVLSGRDGAWQK